MSLKVQRLLTNFFQFFSLAGNHHAFGRMCSQVSEKRWKNLKQWDFNWWWSAMPMELWNNHWNLCNFVRISTSWWILMLFR